MTIVLITGLAAVAVGVVIVFVIRWAAGIARARIAEQRAALESEGIVLDAGVVPGTIRYRDFRAPGVYWGAGIELTRRHLVLTESHLAILGGRVRFHIPRPDLGRYAVGLVDGRLQLVSDDPHGATGHVDMRLAVADPEKWLAALRGAGCKVAA